jgi:hypothetical protein
MRGLVSESWLGLAHSCGMKLGHLTVPSEIDVVRSGQSSVTGNPVRRAISCSTLDDRYLPTDAEQTVETLMDKLFATSEKVDPLRLKRYLILAWFS